MKKLAQFLVLFLFLVPTLSAEPYIPEELKPWVGWVRESSPERNCALGSNGVSECSFLTELKISVLDQSMTFTLAADLSVDTEIQIPGGGTQQEDRLWPESVSLERGGKKESLPVLQRNGTPTIFLEKGHSLVSGTLRFQQLPKFLMVPATVGLLRLTVNGVEVLNPRLTPNGELWLEGKDEQVEESDSLRVTLLRELKDGSPQEFFTQIRLEVGGKAREQKFQRILPSGAIPHTIQSGLNYRYSEKDGLIVQLRPGVHDLLISAVFPRSLEKYAPVLDEPLPAEEFFLFSPNSSFRFVNLTGGQEIDRSQIPLPSLRPIPDDGQLRLLERGGAIEFQTERRGEELQGKNSLSLTRIITLDLEGKGATIKDEFQGMLNQGFRLNMLNDAVLGSVSSRGTDQLISLDPTNNLRGVELRERNVALKAESRVENFSTEFSAVGWEGAVENLKIFLNLPPGYSLFAVSGVDIPPFNSWLHSWTLYEVFFVFLVAGVLYRMRGWKAAAVAIVALGLTHQRGHAPGALLLVLLGLVALLQVLPPENGFRKFLSLLHVVLLLSLAGQMLNFVYSELRGGLFPELVSGTFGSTYEYQEPVYRSESMNAPMPAGAPQSSNEALEFDSSTSDGSGGIVASMKTKSIQKVQRELRIDPNAAIQTGPGIPVWNGNRIELSWRAPVMSSETVKLYLLSPMQNLLLSLVRIGALLALLTFFFPKIRRETLFKGATLLLIFLVQLPFAEADDFPSAELLKDLDGRLVRGECQKECADIQSLRLEETEKGMRMVLSVGALRDSVIALPGPVSELPLVRVSIVGGGELPIRRDALGFLSVRVPKGVLKIAAESMPLLKNSFTLQFPRVPGVVENALQHWSVDGLFPNGSTSSSIRLSRDAQQRSAETAIEEGEALPEYFFVHREFSLGFPWEVQTTVTRFGSAERSTSVRVALLAGERLVDRAFREEDGGVLVLLGRNESQASFVSTLQESPEISLKASPEGRYSEEWVLRCSSMFQCSLGDGIPPTSSVDDTEPRFLFEPWPGDTATVRVVRPKGAEGQTATVENVNVEYRPGLRLLQGNVSFNIRSSQGGNQKLILPEGSEVKSVVIDGQERPIRGRDLLLPVSIGSHAVAINWEQPWEQRFAQHFPAIDLGMNGVNVKTTIFPAESRWVLSSSGEGVGPVVFFWPKLLFVGLMALLLGRIPLLPLSSLSWFLLGLGLISLDAEMLIVPLLWFGAHVFRERVTLEKRWQYNLRQLALIGLTFVFLGVLYAAIQQGLLYVPDMRIEHPSGLYGGFQWYMDRFQGVIAGPSMYSVSLPWVYRPLMFLWSAWLVAFLLRWLRWGWERFAEGALWKKKEPSPSA